MRVTDEAVEVLRHSMELAGMDLAEDGIRLRGSTGLGGGFDVQVEMATDRADGEELVQCGGLNFFVDEQVRDAYPEAILTVEPQHETVTLRPAEPK